MLNIQLECVSNPLDLFHMSIVESAQKTKGHLKKNLEAHYCAIYCWMQY